MERTTSSRGDELLFGWDPMPGIVSIWASHWGNVLIWQRQGEQVICTRSSYRPWLFATTLEDAVHLGSELQQDSERAVMSYHELCGPEGSYRYVLSARSGSLLEHTLLLGASRRLGRQITSLGSLDDTYYRVGAVEQYLMSTGRVFFRGMVYDDLLRLQFDLETTSLDPSRPTGYATR